MRFYRVQSEWPASEDELAAKLTNVSFEPVGSFSEQSQGFEPPADETPGLCRQIGAATLLRLRRQSRVLPAAAVNEVLDERVTSFSQRTGRDPSRKEKRDLKDEVYAELLPRTVTKSDRIDAMYLRDEQILGIGSASANVSEDFLSCLREALGSLRVVPLEFKRPVAGLLTDVFLGKNPAGLTLGRECRMRDSSEPGSLVTWLDVDLADRSVRQHVKEGMSVERLGMQFDGVLRFTLDQESVLRKLRLEGVDPTEDIADDEPLVQFDATFALYSGLIQRLIRAVEQELGRS